MSEIWRKTPLSEFYEVSNEGRVRSLSRTVKCGHRGGTRQIPGKLLKPHVLIQSGYKQVILEGRNKQSVHRLVALAFVPGHTEGLVVNHKNGDRQDNRPENLEWVTQAENNSHAYKQLGRKAPFTGKGGSMHSTSKGVVMKDLSNGNLLGFQCALDAVRQFPELDSGSISRCCKGEYKTHKGFSFRYATEDEASKIAEFGARHGVKFHDQEAAA